MTIIIAFTAASFLASALVLSACAMSSRLSQREGVEENYVAFAEPASVAAKPATPFSVN
jgi:ABC-type oligopeptide transport system substrate-binding subunit